MGFESFRVELDGGKPTMQEAANAITALDHAVRDKEAEMMPSSRCFLVRDLGQAIELELTGPPASISCRFTLCHPPSVDAVFLDLVKALMQRLNVCANICDGVTPEDGQAFTLERFDEFTEACLRCISTRRREWKLAFGNQQLAATTAEAHQQIILPRCMPPVEKVR
ncbi:MAG: hypothetical protein HYR84_15670 [Planctomycetes bacterium]|nr:hypothetical protein [Planctomycetota bacterium]